MTDMNVTISLQLAIIKAFHLEHRREGLKKLQELGWDTVTDDQLYHLTSIPLSTIRAWTRDRGIDFYKMRKGKFVVYTIKNTYRLRAKIRSWTPNMRIYEESQVERDKIYNYIQSINKKV